MKIVIAGGATLADIEFDADTLLHIIDTIDQNTLIDQVDKFGWPKAIISSAHPELDFDVPFYYVDDWLLRTAAEFDAYAILPDNVNTLFAHNFMCNKKYYWRSMLIKLIEYYDLDNGNYTWSGSGVDTDWSKWLSDLSCYLPQEIKNHVLQPITLSPKFVGIPGHDCEINLIGAADYGGNLKVWNAALSSMFTNSAVSLITESIVDDNTCIFTEKTLYSVLGLTFPIWCVGYKSAEHWKNYGFDTFDDIIDHSYQYMQSPVQRCFESVRRNLTLLQDPDKLTDLRTRHMDRLLENRSHMLYHIQYFCARQIKSMPANIMHAYIDFKRADKSVRHLIDRALDML